MFKINQSEITVQDCLDMMQYKGLSTVIDNGQVIGFAAEITGKSDNQGCIA